jgi:hypothetical protein
MRRLLILLFVVLCTNIKAQTPRCHYTADDSLLVCKLLNSGRHDALWFARQFEGRPYVAHTLELYPDDERLVLNTRELDCTTFVDIVVALTLCSQRCETSFSDFIRQLQGQRYWGGECNGYPSRIHYFSDWIDDGTRKGFVSEVQLAEAPFTAIQTLKVNYMSKHPDAYESLKRHPEYLKPIADCETALTGRQYRYIPTQAVTNSKAMRAAVHDGDILATVSTTPGLDIAHLGFAVWHDDGLYLLDASSVHKKVVEEPIPLRSYLQQRKRMAGVRVVRVKQ